MIPPLLRCILFTIFLNRLFVKLFSTKVVFQPSMDPDPVNRRLVGGGVSRNKLHFFYFFTIYMFGCLRGTLVLSKVLRTGFFVSPETVIRNCCYSWCDVLQLNKCRCRNVDVGYPDGSVRKFKRMEKPYFHQSDSGGRFVFTPKCLGDRNRNILVIKYVTQPVRKMMGKSAEKPRNLCRGEQLPRNL